MNDYEIVINWLKEKGIDNVDIKQISYDWVGMGEFAHVWMTESKDRYVAIIKVHPAVESMSIFKRAVLWHEFCHIWDYIESLDMDHEESFIKKWLSKPQYLISLIVPALWVIAKMVWYEVRS